MGNEVTVFGLDIVLVNYSFFFPYGRPGWGGRLLVKNLHENKFGSACVHVHPLGPIWKVFVHLLLAAFCSESFLIFYHRKAVPN